MSLWLSIDELLSYTGEEREKWQRWFSAHSEGALSVPVQNEGRHATVWHLIDHIFLVEKRHTERLQAQTVLCEETGIGPPDIEALFRFGAEARQGLQRLVRELPEEEARKAAVFRVRGQEFPMSPRKLIFHIPMHEVRHWAQIAVALRNAGFTPPGDHDLFYSSAVI
jgi:uncharacterized damage-inducible protein DinB